MGDAVDHPSHYGGADNKFEVIKIIDDWGLGFSLGNAVKYILRAKHKGNELQDLQKAKWYLDHDAGRRIGIWEWLGGFFIRLKPRTIHVNDVVHTWDVGHAAADVLRRIYRRDARDVIAIVFGEYVDRRLI